MESVMCDNCFPSHTPPRVKHQKIDPELMNIINTFNNSFTGTHHCFLSY